MGRDIAVGSSFDEFGLVVEALDAGVGESAAGPVVEDFGPPPAESGSSHSVVGLRKKPSRRRHLGV